MYGAFVPGVYNPEAEEFQSISMTGTGFSEEHFDCFNEQLKESHWSIVSERTS